MRGGMRVGSGRPKGAKSKVIGRHEEDLYWTARLGMSLADWDRLTGPEKDRLIQADWDRTYGEGAHAL